MGIFLAIMAVTALVGSLGVAVWRGLPFANVPSLFFDAPLLVQFYDVILAFVGMVVFVVWLAARTSSARPVFVLFGAGSAVLGVLSFLHGTAWMATAQMKTFRFLAPGIADALIPLGLGLAIGAMAFLVAPKRDAAPTSAG